jgi:HEAT repeat protein
VSDVENSSLLSKKVYFRLLSDLNHHTKQRRLRALERLHEAGEPRSPGPASRRLFDAESDVRSLASVVLEKHGLGSAAHAVLDLFAHGEAARTRAVAALAPLLTAPMPSPHVAVIAATAAGLHELYDAVAAAAAGHADHYVRRAAVEGLYQVNQPRLAAVFLLPSTDPDPGVRRYAAVGLAENGILTGSGRLCRDPDPQVARAAREAFSRPGEPTLVRDAHRRVMERSESFSLPRCGSSLLSATALPSLQALANAALIDQSIARAEAALLTLLHLGRQRHELRELLPADAHQRLTRRLVVEADLEGAKLAPELDPALDGRRVLVVGGDGIEGPLLGALRSAGLAVDWLSGFDNGASRRRFVTLDAVLVLTARVSHAVADHAARIGEESGAVVVHVNKLGQAAVIEAAREALAPGAEA